jgi:hypothetical protein
MLALADEQQHEPRTLGQTAAMHVYWYSPKTLEITYVDTYLFANLTACREAIPKALTIATPLASEGDLVMASCVSMHPPAGAEPKDDGVI